MSSVVVEDAVDGYVAHLMRAQLPFRPSLWSDTGVVRSVLLVDDDDDMRASVSELLTLEGFLVHTARNGQDALDLLYTIDAPALILLDFMMPVMNGSQFLAAKRRDARLRAIPVAILSAWTREWTGEALGVNHVLAKPIAPESLIALVAQYCDRNPVSNGKA
jgi:CheY-like chemotaxis protein